MAKKKTESPFQALEQEAYQAFREWHIWLVLRRHELAAHLDRSQPGDRPKTFAPIGEASRSVRRN